MICAPHVFDLRRPEFVQRVRPRTRVVSRLLWTISPSHRMLSVPCRVAAKCTGRASIAGNPRVPKHDIALSYPGAAPTTAPSPSPGGTPTVGPNHLFGLKFP